MYFRTHKKTDAQVIRLQKRMISAKFISVRIYSCKPKPSQNFVHGANSLQLSCLAQHLNLIGQGPMKSKNEPPNSLELHVGVPRTLNYQN